MMMKKLNECYCKENKRCPDALIDDVESKYKDDHINDFCNPKSKKNKLITFRLNDVHSITNIN